MNAFQVADVLGGMSHFFTQFALHGFIQCFSMPGKAAGERPRAFARLVIALNVQHLSSCTTAPVTPTSQWLE